MNKTTTLLQLKKKPTLVELSPEAARFAYLCDAGLLNEEEARAHALYNLDPNRLFKQCELLALEGICSNSTLFKALRTSPFNPFALVDRCTREEFRQALAAYRASLDGQ